MGLKGTISHLNVILILCVNLVIRVYIQAICGGVLGCVSHASSLYKCQDTNKIDIQDLTVEQLGSNFCGRKTTAFIRFL